MLFIELAQGSLYSVLLHFRNWEFCAFFSLSYNRNNLLVKTLKSLRPKHFVLYIATWYIFKQFQTPKKLFTIIMNISRDVDSVQVQHPRNNARARYIEGENLENLLEMCQQFNATYTLQMFLNCSGLVISFAPC